MRTLLTREDGSVAAINSARLFDIPYFLSTNRPNTSVTLAAYGVSDIISFGVNGDGPLKLTSIAGQLTGTCLINLSINDGRKRVNMTSCGIHSSTFVGSGLKPFYLPQELYMDELRRIEATITDLSGASNTVRLMLRGSQLRKVQADPRGNLRDWRKIENRLAFPFIYGIDGGSVTVTASSTSEQAITIDPEFDFQLFQISGVATSNSYTLDIIDSNTGESLFNSRGDNHYEIASALCVGTNFYPFVLPTPKLFKRGQKITLKFTDTSGSDNTIYLSFAGRNIASQIGGSR